MTEQNRNIRYMYFNELNILLKDMLSIDKFIGITTYWQYIRRTCVNIGLYFKSVMNKNDHVHLI